MAGFKSEALGAEYTYDFDYKAQTNLGGMLNAITAGLYAEPAIIWKTVEGGPLPHTIEQFRQLYADGLTHKNGKIAAYWQLKADVAAAETIEEVTAINWI